MTIASNLCLPNSISDRVHKASSLVLWVLGHLCFQTWAHRWLQIMPSSILPTAQTWLPNSYWPRTDLFQTSGGGTCSIWRCHPPLVSSVLERGRQVVQPILLFALGLHSCSILPPISIFLKFSFILIFRLRYFLTLSLSPYGQFPSPTFCQSYF